MNSSTPQACPFQIDVHCEGTQPSIQPLSMDSGPKLQNQALQKSITTRTGAKALRGQENVFIYTYRGEHRISSLIANKVDNRLCVGVIINGAEKFCNICKETCECSNSVSNCHPNDH